MTLKDIASKFKISLTTVSMCLSGNAARYGIRKELADQVNDYARENGYRPNQAASRLRLRSKTPPLGIVFTYEAGLAKFATLLCEITDYLGKRNREYILMGLKDSHIGKTMSALRSMGVRDVLVLGRLREFHPDDPDDYLNRLFREDWRVAWKLLKDGMHLYAANYIFPLPPEHAEVNFTRVGFNNEVLERDILQRIKDAGLGPVVINSNWTKKESLLIPELIDSKKMILPMAFGTFNQFEAGVEMAKKLLELRSHHPVRTVFLSNDYTAAGVIRGLLDAGVKIPEEVGVIGFGNDAADSYFRRALTSVGPVDINTTMNLLRSICGDLPPFPDNTILDYVLYERESFRFQQK